MMSIYGIWCSIVYVFIGEREEYTTPEPTPTTTTPDPEIIPIELYVLKVGTNSTLLIPAMFYGKRDSNNLFVLDYESH